MKATTTPCETAKVLFKVWQEFLAQNHPKATKLELSSAKSAYINHKLLCEKCQVIYGKE